jgi:hypothetical protein
LQFPDWVEDKEKEDARQKRGVAQYQKLLRAKGELDDIAGLLTDNDTIEV